MTKQHKYTMIKNKYYHWYHSIIDSAKTSNRVKNNQTYFEYHHVIPKSLGGDDSPSNLVLLTCKEHYTCHHLLTRFTVSGDKAKMIYAFWGLANQWSKYRDNVRITNRTYSLLKENISKQLSIDRLGSSNPMYGKDAPNKGIKRPGVGGRKPGFVWSDEEREKHLKARSSEGYYDYLRDPERCRKISNSQKGKIGNATGKIWFNNGIKELYSNECPEGFIQGRLPKDQISKRGMKWYNNGTINKQFKDDNILEGFVSGRLSKK